MVFVSIKYYMINASKSVLSMVTINSSSYFYYYFVSWYWHFQNNLNKLPETLKCKSYNMSIPENLLRAPCYLRMNLYVERYTESNI